MKKAFHIKTAALVTAFAVLAAAMAIPSFSVVFARFDEDSADVNNFGKSVKSLVSDEKNAAGDYELPFIPVETNHEWDDGTVTTQPTCTQPGVKTYTCKLNSKHTYTVVIPAAGHTPSDPVIENEIAPTCETAGGRDEVVYCSVCHEEISRNHITVPALGHNWGDWVRTKEPTESQPGEEQRICKNDSSHIETRGVSPLIAEYSFVDGEIIIVVPGGAVPYGSVFDVRKIVPTPTEVVENVQSQKGSNSIVLEHYEIRLNDENGNALTRLDGEITIKMKMPQQYVGNVCVKVVQEDEAGTLIEMTSRWEGEYICYETDWLEIYN